MKYNSIGEQLIAKAQELDPSYKPDKFNDMSEAIDVILNNSGGGGYKIKKLIITENGLYDNEFEAYKPVYVSVPQTAQSGTLKAFLDATQTTYKLFNNYKGTSVDSLISYNDTSNVTTMTEMFNNCTNLTTVPLLDTLKVTNMSQMFYGCTNLTTVPQFDTSNVTRMSYMFSNCTSLTSIPKLDTSNAVYMDYMFNNCTSLISIPELDLSRVGNGNYIAIFSGCTSLASIGVYGFTSTIDIRDTALEHDALVAFLNQAGKAIGSSQKIMMGSTKLALLSDEEKAIATNKGWTLA